MLAGIVELFAACCINVAFDGAPCGPQPASSASLALQNQRSPDDLVTWVLL
jgi:hypothetical protein